jgi:uncharacterized membrane protein
MTRSTLAASVLGSAVALVATGALGISSASAQQLPSKMRQRLDEMLKMHPGASRETIMQNMQRVQRYHLVRCYGVNAAGKNDCAAGAHSCAGQSTQNNDPQAFVLLPVGDCQKIAGGTLKGPL